MVRPFTQTGVRAQVAHCARDRNYRGSLMAVTSCWADLASDLLDRVLVVAYAALHRSDQTRSSTLEAFRTVLASSGSTHS